MFLLLVYLMSIQINTLLKTAGVVGVAGIIGFAVSNVYTHKYYNQHLIRNHHNNDFAEYKKLIDENKKLIDEINKVYKLIGEIKEKHKQEINELNNRYSYVNWKMDEDYIEFVKSYEQFNYNNAIKFFENKINTYNNKIKEEYDKYNRYVSEPRDYNKANHEIEWDNDHIRDAARDYHKNTDNYKERIKRIEELVDVLKRFAKIEVLMNAKAEELVMNKAE